MKKDEIKNSADLLLYKAIIDFNSAKILFEMFEKGEIEIDIEKVYFDLQQSAEKLIKSILTKNKITFKKTHDIENLILMAEKNNLELMENISELVDLNDYAVEGRYDIICDDIEDSSRYFLLVSNLIEFVKNKKNLYKG